MTTKPNFASVSFFCSIFNLPIVQYSSGALPVVWYQTSCRHQSDTSAHGHQIFIAHHFMNGQWKTDVGADVDGQWIFSRSSVASPSTFCLDKLTFTDLPTNCFSIGIGMIFSHDRYNAPVSHTDAFFSLRIPSFNWFYDSSGDDGCLKLNGFWSWKDSSYDDFSRNSFVFVNSA